MCVLFFQSVSASALGLSPASSVGITSFLARSWCWVGGIFVFGVGCREGLIRLVGRW